MTPERWRQVKCLFDRAVECGPESRIAFVREQCGGDEELRREVESLLASDPETGSLLDHPLMATGIHADSASPAQSDSFGPYAPVRVLGEGGMGTVYLARQQYPIRREVAIKVVKPGMDSQQVLERFESERQALALMEYPNVARVLDAGTSERGRPYFVMEYVDGVPITQYCDRRALRTRQRLQLFIPVCNALQHAHKKGIIHRDVKPSNVLVTEVDGKPVPKVIDFGIARATDQRTAESDAFTLAGQIVGTPEYMSPEQASLDSRDIDTGTDVYSLGVVLYELLVGALPLDMTGQRKALSEVLRAIRETPIPKPTVRITEMGAAAEALAFQRGTDPGQLKRDLSGDLDSIVMKAIEKDRQCRYASASDFASDIERYLRGEPVLAGPPGAAYRMRKFVVRHKRPVAGAAAVVLALVAGIIATAWQARVAGQQRAVAVSERAEAQGQRIVAERQAAEAARQRDSAQAASVRAAAAEGQAQEERNAALAEKGRADKEAATATAVNDFLRNDLLAQASANSQSRPDTKPDPDLKVRTVLERAAARIAGKFDAQPLVEASIRLTIGSTYMELGQYPQAQRELERAVDLRRRFLGETHPETLKAMTSLGALYVWDRKYPQAEALLAKIAESARRALGEEHAVTLRAMSDLGVVLLFQDKYVQAEPIATKVLEISRRVLGEEHPDTLDAMSSLGKLYLNQGKYLQAEPLVAKVAEVRHRLLGDEHPDTLDAMSSLRKLYLSQAKYAEAETLAAKVLEASRRALGQEHPGTLDAMNNLGIAYQYQGKYAEAELLFAKVLEVRRRVLGEEHPSTLVVMINLGVIYQNQGKYSQAEPLAIKVLEVRRRLLGEEHPSTLNALNSLAVLYRDQGKYIQAETVFAKVLEDSRRVLGKEHPSTLAVMNNLSVAYQSQGKYAQAEPLAAKVLDIRRRMLGEERPVTLVAMYNLGVTYLRQGKYVQAEPLLTKALEVQRRVLGPKDPGTTNTKAALGGMWLLQRRYADTEPLLREALNDYEKLPERWERYLIQSMLGGSLAGQQKYTEAEPLLLSGYEGTIQRESRMPENTLFEVETAGDRIVQLYRDWGKPEQAAEWWREINARKAAVAQKQ